MGGLARRRQPPTGRAREREPHEQRRIRAEPERPLEIQPKEEQQHGVPDQHRVADVQQHVGEPGVECALVRNERDLARGQCADARECGVDLGIELDLLAADHTFGRRDLHGRALLELGARAVDLRRIEPRAEHGRRLEVGMGEEVVARADERGAARGRELVEREPRPDAERDEPEQQQRGEPRDRRRDRSAVLVRRHGYSPAGEPAGAPRLNGRPRPTLEQAHLVRGYPRPRPCDARSGCR